MNQLAPLTEVSRAATVQLVRSPGGVEAWLVEDYTVPLIALQCAFRGGASQDPPGKDGLATMLASLLDEGAGPYDSEAFHEIVDDLAVHLHFAIDRDHVSGHLQTLSKNLEPAFDLLRLSVCEARLEQVAIDRVCSQLVAGLRRELKDPDALAARTFRAAAFPGHPYGRAARGEIETLPTLTRDDLVALRARILTRDHLMIAVVGAIDAATLATQLDRTFGALPEKGRLDPTPDVVMSGLGRTIVSEVDVPQATIRFGRPGLDRDDPDYIAGMIVNHILGGGAFTARLFQEVREKRGLAYSVYSQLQNYDHAALVSGGTSTKNESAGAALALIQAQIRDLSDNGPTEDELAKTKRYLIGSYALRFDTSNKIAGNLLHMQLEGHPPSYLDERNKLVAAVTLDDARRAARRLFGDGELLVAIAGKPEGVSA